MFMCMNGHLRTLVGCQDRRENHEYNPAKRPCNDADCSEYEDEVDRRDEPIPEHESQPETDIASVEIANPEGLKQCPRHDLEEHGKSCGLARRQDYNGLM